MSFLHAPDTSGAFLVPVRNGRDIACLEAHTQGSGARFEIRQTTHSLVLLSISTPSLRWGKRPAGKHATEQSLEHQGNLDRGLFCGCRLRTQSQLDPWPANPWEPCGGGDRQYAMWPQPPLGNSAGVTEMAPGEAHLGKLFIQCTQGS